MTDRVGFFDKAKLLEIVQKIPDPPAPVVRAVYGSIRKNISLLHAFVRAVDNPQWVRALHREGFFASPPPAKRAGDSVHCEPWPEGAVLVKLAASVPDVVRDVVQSTRTDNYNVYLALVDAVAALDAAQIGDVWGSLVGEFRDVIPASLVLQKLGGLAQRLAAAGLPAEGLQLLDVTLEPLAPSPTAVGGIEMHTEARGLFSYDDLNRCLGALISAVAAATSQPLIVLLEGKLLTALDQESKVVGVNYRTVGYWRTAIEPTSQDIGQCHRDFLLEQLRDSAEAFVGPGPSEARQLVERYLRSDVLILRRLGIHLVRVSANNYPDLACEVLSAPGALNDVDIHHEVFVLLRDAFAHLAPEEKGKVLQLIIDGPSPEDVRTHAAWVRENTDDQRSEKAIGSRYSESWVRDRLLMIRHVLGPREVRLLEDLNRRLGDRGGMPPEFTHYIGPTTWGTESPLSAEDLKSMSPGEVVDYLVKWRPSAQALRGFGAAPEGLAREFRTELGERWKDYIPEMPRLFRSAAFPIYTTETLHFMAERAKERRESARSIKEGKTLPQFPWQNLIPAVRAAIETWPSARRAEDSCELGFACSVRTAALHVLEGCVWSPRTDQDSFGPAVLRIVRDLLLSLCEDPDPDQEQDRPPEGYMGHGDPATVAINHVRPRAFMTLIWYAIRRAQELTLTGQRWEEKVRQVATSLLDDPALSVRSVYGRCWQGIYWLDEAWARGYHARILPRDAESTELFSAAWDSYVLFGRVTREHYDLMRPLYVRAIELSALDRPARAFANVASSLAGHLCALYWHDLEPLPDPPQDEPQNPLGCLFSKQPCKLHSSFAWHLWKIGESGEQASRDAWPKARRLWEYRLRQRKRLAGQHEYAHELTWFVHWLSLPGLSIEPTDVRELLEESIGPLGAVENSHGMDELIGYLSRQAKSSPEICVEILDRVFAEHGARWWFDEADVRAVLEAAIPAADSCRGKAVAIVHRLGEHGRYSFRNLLEPLRRGR